MVKVALAIPTYNAGKDFEEVISYINEQSSFIDYKIIIDSCSVDETAIIAKSNGFKVKHIKKSQFSHSGTRSLIANKLYNDGFDYVIFMTQDVFLQKNAIMELLRYIKKDKCFGVVTGKQEVDLTKGNLCEYFARKSNYGNEDLIFDKNDINKYGINTIYTSDAFAIYNLNALKHVGFFGSNINVSEDMYAAHKLIQAGYKIGYASKAKVYHTHNYNIKEEFLRYKNIGNFYRDNNLWIKNYGRTTNKGINLAKQELLFLIKEKKYFLIFESIIRNFSKFVGFQIGKNSTVK
jgi:rhamnosyltransferase